MWSAPGHYYLAGLLQVPMRISVGTLLLQRSTGVASRPSVPEFHLALRAEPALFAEWVAALRLAAPRTQTQDAVDLARELLAVGGAALRAGAPATPLRR